MRPHDLLTCTGIAGGTTATVSPFVGMFHIADRCGALATWTCPSGPRCEACAQREMAAIREGKCLLAIIADREGIPRETLAAKYRPLDPRCALSSPFH